MGASDGPLAEVDAVNLPGAYALTVDVATWLPDTYQLIAVYDGAYRRLGQAEYAKHPLSTWEIGWLIVDGAGQFVTGGAADTEVKVRRGSDGFMLDWDDLVFKATGWTELAPTLQETDAVNAPGLYRRAADVSGWMDGQYQAFARYDDGGLVRDAHRNHGQRRLCRNGRCVCGRADGRGIRRRDAIATTGGGG